MQSQLSWIVSSSSAIKLSRSRNSNMKFFTAIGAFVVLTLLANECHARNIIDISRMGIFKAAVLRNQKPVVVYFTKGSCGQCKRILNDLEGIAKANIDTMYLARVDLEQYPELWKEFEITTVPTTRTYYRGQLLRQVEGPLEGAIRAITNNALKSGDKKTSASGR